MRSSFLSKNIEIDDVIKEIESIGFQAKTEEIEEDNKVEKLFAFCLILTIPLFSHMFLNENHILHNPIIQFFWLYLFTLLVAIILAQVLGIH